MAIINPTPITPSVFDKLWVRNLALSFPVTNRGHMNVEFLPYDGASTLNKPIPKDVQDLMEKRKTDTNVEALVTTLSVELNRLSGFSSPATVLLINAPDPSRPVECRVFFADKTSYAIPDCYALCATDPAFASVFQAAMGLIAAVAGFTVS